MRSKITKFLYYLRCNPEYIVVRFIRKIYFVFPDELYLKIIYRLRTGKKLNLDNPITYNEKLQWLKLYDHRPEYTQMVDKIESKHYVEKLIGKKYIIPTISIYSSINEIDFDKLPNSFVLKVSQGGGGGGVVICRDKKKFDKKASLKLLSKHMKQNLYHDNKEWPYKNIVPRILAEEYMVDESGYQLKDYKFFCFNGVPKVLMIATDRYSNKAFDFYDMSFNHLSYTQGDKCAEYEHIKPDNFNEMIEIAKKLSKGIPQLRVDLYNVNGKIFFGELTFFSSSGYDLFQPEEWDYIWGSWIKLPKKTL